MLPRYPPGWRYGRNSFGIFTISLTYLLHFSSAYFSRICLLGRWVIRSSRDMRAGYRHGGAYCSHDAWESYVVHLVVFVDLGFCAEGSSKTDVHGVSLAYCTYSHAQPIYRNRRLFCIHSPHIVVAAYLAPYDVLTADPLLLVKHAYRPL